MFLRDSPGLPIPARGKLAAVQVYESLRVAAPLVSYALLLSVDGKPAVSSSRGAAGRLKP